MPKALLHFTTAEIDALLEGGEMPNKLADLLEESLVAAKAASDGCASVAFFVDHEEDEAEEPSDD